MPMREQDAEGKALGDGKRGTLAKEVLPMRRAVEVPKVEILKASRGVWRWQAKESLHFTEVVGKWWVQCGWSLDRLMGREKALIWKGGVSIGGMSNDRMVKEQKPYGLTLIFYKLVFSDQSPYSVSEVGRFHAFEKAHRMDPKSSGRGVRQFKTYLLHRLQKIKAALRAIRNMDNLPAVRRVGDRDKPVNDILEWLSSVFGFQKGNVANQREHLVLLLANIDRRSTGVEDYGQLDSHTVKHLLDKTFKNYVSWCHYLHCTSILESREVPPTADTDSQQLQLLYIGLYLLIWGEASNIRFMPECICYIFHNMAKQMHGTLFANVQPVSGGTYQAEPLHEEAFLHDVVKPVYEVLRKEARRNQGGKTSHASWRNYDDLNEYFWSDKCFKLGWPMDPKSDFFVHSDESSRTHAGRNQVVSGKKKPKTNFVEVRTFLHLYRSFDRMWIFLILVFQAMVILAWHEDGSIFGIFDEDVIKNILSIFITYAVLNFIQATLDIILSFSAWRSLKPTQILRYLFKFIIAAFWVVILPVCYSRSVPNPTGLVRFFSTLGGNWREQSLYNYLIAIYLIPNILAALLFLLPPVYTILDNAAYKQVCVQLLCGGSFCSYHAVTENLKFISNMSQLLGKFMENSDYELKLERGSSALQGWDAFCDHQGLFNVKLGTEVTITTTEILPLVSPTKLIMDMSVSSYEWHEFFPNVTHNIGVVIAIWAPIVLVYFMDTQIWYAIYATIIGGIYGAFSHLGEIRTLGMLRSRFESVPSAFYERLVPMQKEPRREQLVVLNFIFFYDKLNKDRNSVIPFGYINGAISATSLHVMLCLFTKMKVLYRKMTHCERDLLLVPYTTSDVPVVQWPPFLLASKIPIALDMAKDFKGKEDADLFRKITTDDYMRSAVIECYQTLKEILFGLLDDERDSMILSHICHEIETSIEQRTFLSKFRMSELPSLNDKLEKFLEHLQADNVDAEKYASQIINVLQDIMEIITQDVMNNGHEILERAHSHHQDNDKKERFERINFRLTQIRSWKEKVVRLRLLLTVKESAINVPTNLEARRRITFFANSLYMRMPNAPVVRNMLSFSVLTPYYKEDVLYSEEELHLENEDGISILFYLQKIYPDEWKNFEQRTKGSQDNTEATRQWVSYRGQTLSRTVRGMMYYKEALELQCFLDYAKDDEIFTGFRTLNMNKPHMDLKARSSAMADLKFTYVVSCQVYGAQKKSSDERDQSCYVNILNLMLTYPSLRVAYIDEREATVDGRSQKVYYSVLVKGGDHLDEEIYRIKLPGPPTEIGEGKPENQNHAIIFTRGEALQTIDMNQDNYFEEAFKMRNVLEEFHKDHHGQRRPTILGLREHIFTGSVSSLAWFMSNQETSFVTIGQRVLADPLRVRFHYGHPDIFDRLFHITRGGVSKASRTINLSEDIFSGYNSTLRGGYVTHHEYIQVGKGRDVGMNQISLFEAKVANGNGEQTLSRDVYRLGRRFDFYRMFSFYFTTVGFYFSSMVTVLVVYVFLYGRMYMVLSGLEKRIIEDATISSNKALEEALATQSVFQLGLLLVLPMVMEIGLERGFRTALGDFIIMQLQLASVFFTFQLGTKAHYYGRTILHGGSKYRATGRGFVVFHAKFAENYRLYSRSHFVKGLELAILLVYGLSWLVMITALLALKLVSMGRRRFGTDFQLMFRILKALLFLGFLSIMTVLFVVCGLTISDIFAAFLAFLPTGWAFMLIGQACRPCVKGIGFWDSIMELGRAYECVMGLVIFMPIVILSWFPFVSEFQTRLLFNQAFSRGLQISMILAGNKDKDKPQTT
ncbi:1,3-beta-glucan synthase subunit FKS1-like, domain-1 [Cynara cardunculus var. scolymus]|uniref:1,3-beta-glucan synthase n=1 Tax=Cynara cardunculus var. scolymus TaxID=59895 RepID=A0A118JX86_CYNCS|nr:1,3-beta-glucan synthase subunit FKS1-like, domain-1 [Cynara cardunculus var. scolymus]